VKTSNLWARPAIFGFVWILAAALTLSELATIPAALESASASTPAAHTSFRRSGRAGVQPPSRLATEP
jgi:hypothetical protein